MRSEAFASVVQGPDALAAAELRLRREAWVTRRGFALPEQPWDVPLDAIATESEFIEP